MNVCLITLCLFLPMQESFKFLSVCKEKYPFLYQEILSALKFITNHSINSYKRSLPAEILHKYVCLVSCESPCNDLKLSRQCRLMMVVHSLFPFEEYCYLAFPPVWCFRQGRACCSTWRGGGGQVTCDLAVIS